MRSRVVVAAIALLATTSPALAQRLRGTLTDSSTHEPIPGAVVSVSDSAGKFLARGVAGSDGHFDVPRFDGSKLVHVVRIGYRPIDAIVPATDDVLDLRMRQIASQLSVVTSSGKRVCPGETGNTQALDLWEQARTGFFASIVARDARPPNLRLRYFRVVRDPVRRRVADDTSWIKDLTGDQPFMAARSASAFDTDGYLIEHADGEREYFAPDESVLLDPAFAGSHCLRVVAADPPHAGQVGIGFEPVDPERDSLVDIHGTLWLDAKTLDLRTLDFEYTNVERVRDGIGGNVFFQSMPTGVPMIVRWTIHSPIIATDESSVSPEGVRHSLPPRPQRSRFRVLGYQLLGAEARRVNWSDGTSWLPRLSSIQGVVADLHGLVIEGARVWLSGMPDTVVTDSMGVFRLPRPMGGGLFTLLAADSVLAGGGINQTPAKTVLVTDDRSPTSDIDADVLRMYPRADALRSICPSGKYVPGMGVAILRVVDTTGAQVIGARVEMETLQRVVAGDTLARPVRRAGESGINGTFVVCGAALDQPMTFRASHHGARGESGIARWTNDIMILPVVLRLGPP